MNQARPQSIIVIFTRIAMVALYLNGAMVLIQALIHINAPVTDHSEFAAMHNLSVFIFSMLAILLSIITITTTHVLAGQKTWAYVLNTVIWILMMPVLAISGIQRWEYLGFALNTEVLPVLVLACLLFAFIVKMKRR